MFNSGEWELKGSDLTEDSQENIGESGEDGGYEESGEEYLLNDDGDSAWEYVYIRVHN